MTQQADISLRNCPLTIDLTGLLCTGPPAPTTTPVPPPTPVG